MKPIRVYPRHIRMRRIQESGRRATLCRFAPEVAAQQRESVKSSTLGVGCQHFFHLCYQVSQPPMYSLHHEKTRSEFAKVGLAMEHDCPFLTADRRLFRASGGRHPSLRLVR